MMDCADCEPRLIDHASHELPEDERVEVARHLAGCSECALEYCRLQADLEGLVEAHAETPSPRVFEALRKEVARQHRPSWWSWSLRVLVRPIPAYGAVMVALVPAALWLVTRGPAPVPPGADDPTPPSSPTLTHYDATELPPDHRDVL